MKSEIFLCGCAGHCSGIGIEKFEEDEIYLTLWNRGFQPRMKDWKTKLRYIWNLLFTGTAWADEIVIKNETARQLGEYLLSISSEPVVNMTTCTNSGDCESYVSCPECGTFNHTDIKLCNNCGEEL